MLPAITKVMPSKPKNRGGDDSDEDNEYYKRPTLAELVGPEEARRMLMDDDEEEDDGFSKGFHATFFDFIIVFRRLNLAPLPSFIKNIYGFGI